MFNQERFNRFFKWSEFDSPDALGSGEEFMNRDFVALLVECREECQFPFKINSGYRTEAHNSSVGGSAGSMHKSGRAVDIYVGDGLQTAKLVKAALNRGLRAFPNSPFGSSGFVHIDNKTPQQVRTYN